MAKRKILILSFIFFVFWVFIFFLLNSQTVVAPEKYFYENKIMEINGKSIVVEIADTLEKQAKGLSGRQSMPGDQGMLFIFSAPDHYSFWMKDMLFDLDFIWISGNTVAEIDKNVKPEDYEPASTRRSSLGGPPKVLIPKNKIDKVLEVNAGTAERLGIKEGDEVKF